MQKRKPHLPRMHSIPIGIYRPLRRPDRRLSDREALACPMDDAGSSPPSKAAAMNSAGKSMCTPSEYVYASRGEYAGGFRLVIGVASTASRTSSELSAV